MSRMIPSLISEEDKIKSPAEAKIFEWLRDMQWGNATVLHSLPLKDHIKKSFGEIDFVVLCEKGVLCVEVKGGFVERKEGMWGFTGRSKTADWKPEGPYKQAQGNMKSLKQYLEKRLPKSDPINNCRWACTIMTPDCIIKTDDDTEVIPEITYNLGMTPKNMPAIFDRSFRYWHDTKHYGGDDGLSSTNIERLATILRGDFQFVPPLSLLIERSEDQLVSTTDEQLMIMQGMLVNQRMLIEGGAGTGKTLLAAEQCRKSAAIGEKVLFLCFNQMIAAYVREVFEHEKHQTISVYTYPDLMMEYCGLKTVPEGENEETFFKQVLPSKFLEKCGEGIDESDKYDRIIIDEGQDLMNMDAYLGINEILRGGWDRGKWTIYYDPRQNLFRTEDEFTETWNALRSSGMFYPLTVNCRNTKQIAMGNYAVTHVYKPVIMRGDGEEIVYKPYKDKKNEAAQLFDEIRRLRSEGLGKKDITILSYYRIDNPNSCLYGVDIPSDIGPIAFNLKNNFLDNKKIRYYTVQSFKGMESKAVIMIDVDNFSNQDKVLLNYVGMSRARSYLVFFFDSSLSQERQERLLQSLLQ